MTETADRWQYFQSQFRQLAGEEEQIERAYRKDRLLRAHCDYNDHPTILHEKGKPEHGHFCLLNPPETGLWMLGDGVSDDFQARFRALASRAGIALGSPKGTVPEDFWLHRLYLDMLENKSDQLFAASRDGGVIVRVCVASATFCARLERQALEQSEFGNSTGAAPLRINSDQAEPACAQNSATSEQSVESKSTSAASAIGRNINNLRKECGWSLNKLAKETGIDKKSILSHVNKGARPTPRILREYAQAFSKALERKIVAPDLEK